MRCCRAAYYIASPNLSILCSDVFDIGVMKAHSKGALDCRRITKCSEFKAIVETGFE